MSDSDSESVSFRASASPAARGADAGGRQFDGRHLRRLDHVPGRHRGQHPVRCALARGRVATVAVNSFVFKQPVLIGDLVSFYAQVVRVGRTSITVDVEVFAQRGIPARSYRQSHGSDLDLRGRGSGIANRGRYVPQHGYGCNAQHAALEQNNALRHDLEEADETPKDAA